MSAPAFISPFPLAPMLSRLSLNRPAVADLTWLAQAYRAWTHTVPFTNLGKLAAVRAGTSLPSLEPSEVAAQFLADGSCGTCFSHALAFAALLRAVGYDARNYVGHTLGEDGVRGEHATTIVHMGEDTWLVDTALPHGRPLALFRDRASHIEGVMTPMRATPEGSLWRLDFEILHRNERRWAVLAEPLRDLEHATDRWARTLEERESPFNKLPVARLELEGGSLTLAGSKLFILDGSGLRTEDASPASLRRFGIEPDAYQPLWVRPA